MFPALEVRKVARRAGVVGRTYRVLDVDVFNNMDIENLVTWTNTHQLTVDELFTYRCNGLSTYVGTLLHFAMLMENAAWFVRYLLCLGFRADIPDCMGRYPLQEMSLDLGHELDDCMAVFRAYPTAAILPIQNIFHTCFLCMAVDQLSPLRFEEVARGMADVCLPQQVRDGGWCIMRYAVGIEENERPNLRDIIRLIAIHIPHLCQTDRDTWPHYAVRAADAVFARRAAATIVVGLRRTGGCIGVNGRDVLGMLGRMIMSIHSVEWEGPNKRVRIT